MKPNSNIFEGKTHPWIPKPMDFSRLLVFFTFTFSGWWLTRNLEFPSRMVQRMNPPFEFIHYLSIL